jgi:hypothetical protein
MTVLKSLHGPSAPVQPGTDVTLTAVVEAGTTDGTVSVSVDGGASLSVPIPVIRDVPPSLPSGVTGVRIGEATHLVAGVNPTSSTYPGGRSTDQLVLYTSAAGPTTRTNRWGVEVSVVGRRITVVNDRQSLDVPTVIPTDGYVLSGHGAARTWLLDHAKMGLPVTVITGGEVEPPPPSSGSEYPNREIAVYKMLWSVNYPPIASVPAEVNVVRLAFAQGSPPQLVGWGREGKASLLAGIATLRARGCKITVSVGGSGGAFDTRNRTAFVAGIDAIDGQLGGQLDGLDWDLEAGAMVRADVVAIGQDLARRHPDWGFSFAPNGSNVSQYLPAAVEYQRLGLLSSYGQQFYDAPVSVSAAGGRIAEAIIAGIPPAKIAVGMMVGSSSVYWTNAQCKANMTALAREYGVHRAYLWEAARAGTAEWARDMRVIISP